MIQKFELRYPQIAEQMFRDYQSGECFTIAELIKKYNLNYTIIYRMFKDNNIQRRTRQETQNYKPVRLLKSKVNRKYYFNENVFDIINTPEKAYWLGFLMADGYIVGNVLGLDLAIRDKKHLEKYKNFWETNKLIRPYENKKKHKVRLVISSPYVVDKIMQYGIVPKKTFKTFFPSIPSQFYVDFIRGVFDGDGTNQKKKVKHFRFQIVATRRLAISIQNILIENCWVKKVKLQTEKRVLKRHPNLKLEDQIVTLTYRGNRQAKRIFDFLYPPNCICLDRKRIQYETHFERLL